MMFHVVRSEEDYDATLKRIEALMGAEDETAINELEVLSTLVHVYENEHHPIIDAPLAAERERTARRCAEIAEAGGMKCLSGTPHLRFMECDHAECIEARNMAAACRDVAEAIRREFGLTSDTPARAAAPPPRQG